MKLLKAAARVPASKIEAAQLRHWKLIEQCQGDIEAGVCRDERVMLGERGLCRRGPFRLVVVDRPDMEEPYGW